MLEYGDIISLVITFAHIFLTFSLVTILLYIRVYWWITLAYSAVIMPISSENRWIMLLIFLVCASIYYFLASRMQLKLTVLAIVIHFFSSHIIGSIMIFVFLVVTPLVSYGFVRSLSVFVYIALLGFIKYRKFNIANLIHNKMMFTLSSIMMLTSIIIYSYAPITREDVLATTRIYDSLLMTVIQFVIVYLVITLNKSVTEIEKHEFHSLYTDTLVESLDNLRLFKHGSRNMVNTLLGYCRLGQLDKAKSYLVDIAEDMHHDINVETINNELKDNMPYLYGIVLAKVVEATTSRVNFEINITANKFELKTVSELQLSRMVGNLLNNAFDAAKQAEYKSVALNVSNFDKYRIKIEVTNSVKALVDTSRLTDKGYSTKEGHSGLGLYQVKSIIERQRKEGYNVKFEFHSSDETFTAVLYI